MCKVDPISISKRISRCKTGFSMQDRTEGLQCLVVACCCKIEKLKIEKHFSLFDVNGCNRMFNTRNAGRQLT